MSPTRCASSSKAWRGVKPWGFAGAVVVTLMAWLTGVILLVLAIAMMTESFYRQRATRELLDDHADLPLADHDHPQPHGRGQQKGHDQRGDERVRQHERREEGCHLGEP